LRVSVWGNTSLTSHVKYQLLVCIVSAQYYKRLCLVSTRSLAFIATLSRSTNNSFIQPCFNLPPVFPILKKNTFLNFINKIFFKYIMSKFLRFSYRLTLLFVITFNVINHMVKINSLPSKSLKRSLLPSTIIQMISHYRHRYMSLWNINVILVIYIKSYEYCVYLNLSVQIIQFTNMILSFLHCLSTLDAFQTK
jgi:hypothetical protein